MLSPSRKILSCKRTNVKALHVVLATQIPFQQSSIVGLGGLPRSLSNKAKCAMWVASEIWRYRCWLGPEETELYLGVCLGCPEALAWP